MIQGYDLIPSGPLSFIVDPCATDRDIDLTMYESDQGMNITAPTDSVQGVSLTEQANLTDPLVSTDSTWTSIGDPGGDVEPLGSTWMSIAIMANPLAPTHWLQQIQPGRPLAILADPLNPLDHLYHGAGIQYTHGTRYIILTGTLLCV